MSAPKFPLGKIVATQGVVALLGDDLNPVALGDAVRPIVERHQSGDWGDVDEHDQAVNDEAVEVGNRILSAYTLEGEKVWIITEWDRSYTTILRPEEY